MYYSDDIIEEVRSRNDIVDVISEYVGLKKAGANEYKCCCPFHQEKTPSFMVNRSKQIFKCFGCGAGGNVFAFLMKYENDTFPEAVQKLAKRAGIDLPEQELTEQEKRAKSRREKLYEINRSAAAYYHYLLTKTELGKNGYRYYREKRQFTDDTIYRFGLGYASKYPDDLYQRLKKLGYPDELMQASGLVNFDERRGPHDVFWNRVMVPITDQAGRVIAFGGRVLGDGLPKYVNTKDTEIFNKRRNLFAFDRARHSKRRGMILCEGYMDVISQHQAGFDNAIASLGTAFTGEQASLIKRYTSEVYLAYDSDTAGVGAAMRAIGILRPLDMSQRVIDLKPAKDPDEFLKSYGAEAYEERIRNAETGRMFEIAETEKKYELRDPEEKTKFMKEAAGILAGISDPAERGNYADTVAARYMMDKNEFRRLITDAGLSGKAERVQEVSPAARRPDRRIKKDPDRETQKTLLTMLVNDPGLFQSLEGIVTPEDFTAEGMHEVAAYVFEKHRKGQKVQPAEILNHFEDLETQQEVSSMFTSELEFEPSMGEYEEAVTDIVRKVKIGNIRKAQKNDGADAIELARRKNEILKLKIHV